MTSEEVTEFSKHLNIRINESFAKQAPARQEELKAITTPIEDTDARFIVRCLLRKQITVEMIPKNVFEEVKKSYIYDNFRETLLKEEIINGNE